MLKPVKIRPFRSHLEIQKIKIHKQMKLSLTWLNIRFWKQFWQPQTRNALLEIKIIKIHKQMKLFLTSPESFLTLKMSFNRNFLYSLFEKLRTRWKRILSFGSSRQDQMKDWRIDKASTFKYLSSNFSICTAHQGEQKIVQYKMMLFHGWSWYI